jgi:large subunit ribosomal protein L2
MAVAKSKPTSAGRRHHVRVVNDDLHKGRPYAPLLEKKSVERWSQQSTGVSLPVT